jgi:nucleotidyltransferase substrate binding protein (TIGR01987 family)
MSRERFLERVNDFKNAAVRLREALGAPDNNFMCDAIIQRFEFTYELAWKAMKLWLGFKDIDVRNAPDTLAEALSQGLIDDGNGWSKLHEMRNLTSHTYDQEKATEVVSFVRDKGIVLFEALAKRFDKVVKSL